jgi:hypothetical protein
MDPDTIQGYACVAVALTLLTVVLVIIVLSVGHWVS